MRDGLGGQWWEDSDTYRGKCRRGEKHWSVLSRQCFLGRVAIHLQVIFKKRFKMEIKRWEIERPSILPLGVYQKGRIPPPTLGDQGARRVPPKGAGRDDGQRGGGGVSKVVNGREGGMGIGGKHKELACSCFD